MHGLLAFVKKRSQMYYCLSIIGTRKSQVGLCQSDKKKKDAQTQEGQQHE